MRDTVAEEVAWTAETTSFTVYSWVQMTVLQLSCGRGAHLKYERVLNREDPFTPRRMCSFFASFCRSSRVSLAV